MKTRLTLILVLLIYIGAASHTHAQRIKEHTKNTEESMNDFIYRSMITVMELDDAMEEMERWDTKNGKV